MDKLPEDGTAFWASFNAEVSATRLRLESSTLTAGDLDSVRTNLAELQKYATESTSILPPYDIRRTQEILDVLGKELREAEVRLKPKKKFAFSSKNKEKGTTTIAPAVSAGEATLTNSNKAEESVAPSKDAEGGYTLRGLASNEVVVLTEKELGKNENSVHPPLLITNCNGITVSARCLLGAARLENCTDCHVFLGPCSTSVYLEGCVRCTVFIASHQLRIHKSMGCRLYVRVNSHPIIEDCSDMGFAPYSLVYKDITTLKSQTPLEAQMQEAGLQDARCWDNVVDFRWHRTTASPNWMTLAAIDRLSVLPTDIAAAGWEILTQKEDNGTSSVFACDSKPAVVETREGGSESEEF